MDSTQSVKGIDTPPVADGTGSAPQHRVEAELARLQDDVARLRNLARESQRLATIGTAAAMFAHEFNNMMTPVSGYAKHALKTQDPDMMKKALRTTLTQTESVLGMAERILGMAIDEPVAFKPTPVRQAVDEAIKCLCRDLSKDNITISINVDEGLEIWADPKQLRHAFFNLLLNARDALESSPRAVRRITIAAESTDDDLVRITVSDNGCGIPPEQLHSVFDPFFTTKKTPGARETSRGLQSARTSVRGSGLGLAICRDIIEEHRGRITVHSPPEAGTTFTLTLPSAR